MRHKIITEEKMFKYSVFFKETSGQNRVHSFVVTCRF